MRILPSGKMADDVEVVSARTIPGLRIQLSTFSGLDLSTLVVVESISTTFSDVCTGVAVALTSNWVISYSLTAHSQSSFSSIVSGETVDISYET